MERLTGQSQTLKNLEMVYSGTQVPGILIYFYQNSDTLLNGEME